MLTPTALVCAGAFPHDVHDAPMSELIDVDDEEHPAGRQADHARPGCSKPEAGAVFDDDTEDLEDTTVACELTVDKLLAAISADQDARYQAELAIEKIKARREVLLGETGSVTAVRRCDGSCPAVEFVRLGFALGPLCSMSKRLDRRMKRFGAVLQRKQQEAMTATPKKTRRSCEQPKPTTRKQKK